MTKKASILITLSLLTLASGAAHPTEPRPAKSHPVKSSPLAEHVTKGRDLFQAKCEMCHGRGIEKPATFLLAKRYQGQVPGAIEDRTDLDPAYVHARVRGCCPGMPAFRPSEITDNELADIIAYLTRKNRAKGK